MADYTPRILSTHAQYARSSTADIEADMLFRFSGIRSVAILNTLTPPFYIYLVLWDLVN